MSKRLAGMKKGKRKDFIVALLAAAERVYQETGQLIDTYEIAAAIAGTTGTPLYEPQARAQMIAQPRQQRCSARSVEVTRAGKASTQTVAANFLSSMKGLASGFFD
jgi:hypothetical protein